MGDGKQSSCPLGSVGPTRERGRCGLWDSKRPEGGRARQWRTGEAGSCRAPDVAMMQAADFGDRDDQAEFRRLNWPSVGCVLVERKVSPRLVIVDEVTGQNAAQVVFAQHEDMIEALAADRGDEAL